MAINPTLANDQNIKDVLESINSKLGESVGFMKDTLELRKLEFEENEEARRKTKIRENLADIDNKRSERKVMSFSKLKESMPISGGILGGSGLMKAGLLALASPFILSFAKGLLFGEQGLFNTIGKFFTEGEGLEKTIDIIKKGLSNELVGIGIGTLLFGKKFLFAQLAIKAAGGILEEKIRDWTGLDVDIPTGPIATTVALIASSLVLAGSKRALFSVGGKAMSGLLKGGGKMLGKAAIAAGAMVGADKLLGTLAAKKGAEEAAEATVKQAAKNVGKQAGVRIIEQGPGRLSYQDVETGQFIKKEEGIKRLKEQGFDATGKKLGLKKVPANAIKPVAKKAVSKLALKALPFVGTLAGLGFAVERLVAKDYTSASLNAAAGAADLVPVVGTAASIAGDVAAAGSETFHTIHGISFNPSNTEHQAAMSDIAKVVKNEIFERGSTGVQQRIYQQMVDEGATQSELSNYRVSQEDIAMSSMPAPNLPVGLASTATSISPEEVTRIRKLQGLPNLEQKTRALDQGSRQMAAAGSPVIVRGGDSVKGGNTVSNSGNTVTNITNIVDPTKSLSSGPAFAK